MKTYKIFLGGGTFTTYKGDTLGEALQRLVDDGIFQLREVTGYQVC